MYEEWSQVVDWAQEFVRSEPGFQRLEQLKSEDAWATSIPEAQGWQDALFDLQKIADQDALWAPLQDLATPLESLEFLKTAGRLSAPQTYVIALWIDAAEAWAEYPKEKLPAPIRQKVLSFFYDPKLNRLLKKSFDPTGEISDTATPRIQALVQQLHKLKEESFSQLKAIASQWSADGYLQDSFTDLENGRMVLPVKVGALGKARGQVQRLSHTEATAFLEPEALGPLRLKISETEAEIRSEKEKCLEEILKLIRPFSEMISFTVHCLGEYDSIRARTLYGRAIHGQPILLDETREFSLDGTAHPLLFKHKEESEITKNSLHWQKGKQALLITGPNTGGKTVFLKNLAIAAISARTGFPLTARSRPKVPYFKWVCLDVGDIQDLEQNLSTFAGHIQRFKEFLERATDESLLLLDELNTATDPEEGSALSRAILEAWMDKGAHVVATTHDPKLKLLGLQHPALFVASMRFDEKSRMPTYQLDFGVPGNSRALETARRLGLPEEILNRARDYLSDSHKLFEKSLSQLDLKLNEYARLNHELKQALTEAQRKELDFSQKLESGLSEILEKAKNRVKRNFELISDTYQIRLRDSSTMSKSQAKQTHSAPVSTDDLIKQALSKTKEDLDHLGPEVKPFAEKLSQTLETETSQVTQSLFNPGDKVEVVSLKTQGTVIESIDSETVRVAAGILKMTAKIRDLRLLKEGQNGGFADNSSNKKKSYTVTLATFTESGTGLKKRSVSTTLDIRGQRFDEAMRTLEKFLEAHSLDPNPKDVIVIHGFGTGALREGTKKLLDSLNYVIRHRDAGPEQGGSGATVVTL